MSKLTAEADRWHQAKSRDTESGHRGQQIGMKQTRVQQGSRQISKRSSIL